MNPAQWPDGPNPQNVDKVHDLPRGHARRRRAFQVLWDAGVIDVMLSTEQASTACGRTAQAVWTWRLAIAGADPYGHRFWISRRRLMEHLQARWGTIPQGVADRLKEFDGHQIGLCGNFAADVLDQPAQKPER